MIKEVYLDDACIDNGRGERVNQFFSEFFWHAFFPLTYKKGV